ncbi:hypothetical protein Mgra_00009453, partial [Meloidogyne graminicola]
MYEKFLNSSSSNDLSTTTCSCSTELTLENRINALEVEKDKTNIVNQLILTKLDLVN